MPHPDAVDASATTVMGGFLRDNAAAGNFHVLGPAETKSNYLQAVLQVSPRA